MKVVQAESVDGYVDTDRRHAQAKAGPFDFFVSGHSLAEVYAVLTRLPRSPQITPGEALQLIQDNVSTVATVITLAGDDYHTLSLSGSLS